jgi:dCMP deaminase
MTTIPSWDEYFINLCNQIKLRSKDKTKVGSIIISKKDNRILSTGYNGLKAGCNDNIDWNDRKLVHQLVVHAEMNTIRYLNNFNEEMILYSTTSPCQICMKLIICHNIKKIIYENSYKDIDVVKDICNFYNIEIIQFNSNKII